MGDEGTHGELPQLCCSIEVSPPGETLFLAAKRQMSGEATTLHLAVGDEGTHGVMPTY